MQDFELCLPTKIVFGKGKISLIGSFAKDYGKKLLLVYGMGSIKKNGVYQTVIKSLKDNNLEIIEHSGVKPNPVVSHARKGIEIAKSQKVDFILAVGGGSVIDEAKAIAAGALYDGDVWDFYNGKSEIKKALPVLTVLTVPATASEYNGGTVLTNEEKKQKFGFINQNLYPKVSILDPSVTLTIPADYTAYAAVDAVIHLLEGYFTSNDPNCPIQDRYVEGLVKTIIEATNTILKDLTNYQARATFMWAASLAWNGLGTAGIGDFSVPNHMFGHILGAYYDLAHGATLSIIVPGWMKYNYKKNISKYVKFAKNVFEIKGSDDEDTALKGIEALKNWFIQIKSPVSFKDANIPTNEIDKLAGSILELADVWNVKDYDINKVKEILSLCL